MGNCGPTSKALEDRLLNDWKVLDDAEPDATRNALPADMLTMSGSGLDPNISPANAALQVARVAKLRGAPPERVAALVERPVADRSFGVFGEPRVNVLHNKFTLAYLVTLIQIRALRSSRTRTRAHQSTLLLAGLNPRISPAFVRREPFRRGY